MPRQGARRLEVVVRRGLLGLLRLGRRRAEQEGDEGGNGAVHGWLGLGEGGLADVWEKEVFLRRPQTIR